MAESFKANRSTGKFRGIGGRDDHLGPKPQSQQDTGDFNGQRDNNDSKAGMATKTEARHSGRGQQLMERLQETPGVIQDKVSDFRDDVQDRVHDIRVSEGDINVREGLTILVCASWAVCVCLFSQGQSCMCCSYTIVVPPRQEDPRRSIYGRFAIRCS